MNYLESFRLTKCIENNPTTYSKHNILKKSANDFTICFTINIIWKFWNSITLKGNFKETLKLTKCKKN